MPKAQISWTPHDSQRGMNSPVPLKAWHGGALSSDARTPPWALGAHLFCQFPLPQNLHWPITIHRGPWTRVLWFLGLGLCYFPLYMETFLDSSIQGLGGNSNTSFLQQCFGGIRKKEHLLDQKRWSASLSRTHGGSGRSSEIRMSYRCWNSFKVFL